MVDFGIPSKAFFGCQLWILKQCAIPTHNVLHDHLASSALQYIVRLLMINFNLYGILGLMEILKTWCRLGLGYSVIIKSTFMPH